MELLVDEPAHTGPELVPREIRADDGFGQQIADEGAASELECGMEAYGSLTADATDAAQLDGLEAGDLGQAAEQLDEVGGDLGGRGGAGAGVAEEKCEQLDVAEGVGALELVAAAGGGMAGLRGHAVLRGEPGGGHPRRAPAQGTESAPRPAPVAAQPPERQRRGPVGLAGRGTRRPMHAASSGWQPRRTAASSTPGSSR